MFSKTPVFLFSAFLALVVGSLVVLSPARLLSHAGASFANDNITVGKNLTTGQTAYSDPVSVSKGQRVRLKVLVQNQGATDAANTNVVFNLSNAQSPKATITADGVSSVSDGVALNPSGATLNFVSGSGKKYGPGCDTGCALADAIVSSGVSLGSVSPGVTTSYQVSIEADVVGDPPVGNADKFLTGNIFDGGNRTQRLVDWQDPIPAHPGEIIEFRLRVVNTSGSPVSGVHVRGALPSGYSLNPVAQGVITAPGANLVSDGATVQVSGDTPQTLVYLPGHGRKFGPGCESGCSISDDIAGNGVDLGTVNPGEANSYQVAFKATVSNVPGASPSPTPTPSPTPHPSPSPTPSPSPSPTPTATPTPSPTPTPTPNPVCNRTCNQDSDCGDSSYVCSQQGSSKVCRLQKNPGSSSCALEGGFFIRKYNDHNGNGYQDSGDEGLSWKFQWDQNGDGNWHDYETFASSLGEGGVVTLPDGAQVRIREKSVDGWTATTATEVTLHIRAGENQMMVFGNWQGKPQVLGATTVKQLPKSGIDIGAGVVASLLIGAVGVLIRVLAL